MMEFAAFALETLRSGEGLNLYRAWPTGTATSVLLLSPHSRSAAGLARLEHELSLAGDLNQEWAVRPLSLIVHDGHPALMLSDPGGAPLDVALPAPLPLPRFLHMAVALAGALHRAHQRGLIHKDIKPSNVFINEAGEVRLTGFGIASRLLRERQASSPPEIIAGTFAYMAPEQTGRMNRSIDARSDLYSLGVTLYQLLTGTLPFAAADPMEWIHCHIARPPAPPGERVEGVPGSISDIIMKLLAKTAEERYQTAAGVEYDLRTCLEAWDRDRRIDPFRLGRHDRSERLLIPETLYGRQVEIDALIGTFHRVMTSGNSDFVLVTGYAGIGKSSLVNELHEVMVPPRGLFAAGKFDQYKRGIPYATLAQAFQSLVRELLGRNDAELEIWRKSLLEAVGPNGQLIAHLIPELTLIIGEQPPAPDLPPQDQQARFQLVFRRFLGVFARPEHPLTLFLDDLQWLDTATLDLIEHLATHPEVKHLLLIGAYRSNEVAGTHPLARMIEAIGAAGRTVREIRLLPLLRADVERLLAETLRCETEEAQPLADLVFEKTAGNPFFTIQFILALAEEALLWFDARIGYWTWDLPRIRDKGLADNVADLMAGKLGRLPPATQHALGQLACLGNTAETATLALVNGRPEAELHAELWEAVRAGLIQRSDGVYIFQHDRIQEAAYALIPEGDRARWHLEIGRLLAARTAPEALEESIFDIVNQFDRAAALISAREERELVAELNLMAARRAKDASAYAAALDYSSTGCALLDEDAWQRRYRLAFDLALGRAQCLYLDGDLAAAEQQLEALSGRTRTNQDAAAVACDRINLYTNLDRSDRAVEIGLAYLEEVDGPWSLHTTESDVRVDYERLQQRIGALSMADLIDLPVMTDPDRRATMDVLTVLTSPAHFTNLNLCRRIIGRMAMLSLEHGNSDGSPLAYAFLGASFGAYLGNYKDGYRLGRVGLDLIEKRGLNRLSARVNLVFAVHVAHWTQPLPTCRAFLRRALAAAQEAGDVTYMAYAVYDLLTNRCASGALLEEVEREAVDALSLVRKMRFGLIDDSIVAQLRLIRMLRGPAGRLGSLDDDSFDEAAFEQHLDENPRLAFAVARYWLRKLQACVLAGDAAAAFAAACKIEPASWTMPTQVELPEYAFYAALALAGHCDMAPLEERPRSLEALVDAHGRIALWAKNCPENFAAGAALVGAEIARLEGRELDALRLYEDAVRLARKHGLVQVEALAAELAAKFSAARGFGVSAGAYLRSARESYRRWGALSKVQQLEQLHPELRQEPAAPHADSTAGTPTADVDLATVIKVSQTISSEIDLRKLIDTLMVIALEHAGGDRGLLILSRNDELQIEAEATVLRDRIEVRPLQAGISPELLPVSVLRYVVRTRQSLLFEDAGTQSSFSDDEFIRTRRCRSILCLPLIKQTKLVGVLYLENSHAPYVFTPGRVAILRLLASQAAISLENASLYSDLRSTEAHLAEAQRLSRMGSWVWDTVGNRITLSEHHCEMFGFTREQLHQPYERLQGSIHPDDRAGLEELEMAAVRAGTDFSSEFRVIMPDGSIRHFHSRGGPSTHEYSGAGEFTGTIMDITERKQRENEMRKLASLIENSTDFIGYVPSFDRADYLNAAGRRLVGLDLDADLTGLRVVDFHPESEQRRFHEEILPALARDQQWAGERTLRHFKTHAEIPVLQTIFYITESGTGRQIGIATICRDITERKQVDARLRASLEEKEALLKEVHHRVKNNLQLITSLLNLQASGIADPAVSELFAESRNRVRTMALVHENLYRAGNFARVPMRTHIRNLCDQLSYAYGMDGRRVELEIEVDDLELEIDRAISVGLIINELVSNALKHAFPQGRAGRLSVALRSVGEDGCMLVVRDDGVGLPLAFDTQSSGSLGLQLVHDLTHQLHGSVAILRDGGTSFQIAFQLHQPT